MIGLAPMYKSCFLSGAIGKYHSTKASDLVKLSAIVTPRHDRFDSVIKAT